MVPTSRLKEIERRRAGRTTIKTVERFRHDAWHYVFDTLTPFESVLLIILRLAPDQFCQATVVAKWQDSTYRFKLGDTIDRETMKLLESTKILFGNAFEEALSILFGDRDWCGAIAIIVEEWSPDHYFKFVKVETSAADGSTSSFKYAPSNQKEPKKRGRRRRKERQKKFP